MLLTFLKIINILFRFIVSQLNNFKTKNTFSSSGYFWYSVQKFKENRCDLMKLELAFFLLGISRVKNISSWVGQFFFLVGVLWDQNFFSCYFMGPNFFSRGYFVGPKLFLVVILWAWFFFSWLIPRFKDFQLLAAWERVRENRNS